jgi:small conductance mechanosensitive channel
MNSLRVVLVERTPDDEKDKRIETLMRGLRDVLGVAVAAVVLMLLSSELGLSITPLLGTAGVAGVTLALASQGLARDFLAGVSLLLDNKLRVGDEVEVAGKSGVVESLSLRTIRLRDRDGTVHFVRTGDVGTVSNRSLQSR